LPVHRTVQFDEGATICEFSTQHSPILSTGLCETVLANVALNITTMSVDPMSAIPVSVLLKDDTPSCWASA
jgi:hypothetical protein